MRVGVRLWLGGGSSMESFQSGDSGVGGRPVRVEEGSGLCLWPGRDRTQGYYARMATVQKAGMGCSGGRVGWGSAGREAGLKQRGAGLGSALGLPLRNPLKKEEETRAGVWGVGPRIRSSPLPIQEGQCY